VVEIESSVGAQGARIALRGELTLDEIAEVGRAAQPHITSGVPLRLDLSGLTFLDSTGLSLIVELAGHARDARWDFRIVNPSPAARQVLDITGVDVVVPIESTD
jgi:anti-sigma B factor antagonist